MKKTFAFISNKSIVFSRFVKSIVLFGLVIYTASFVTSIYLLFDKATCFGLNDHINYFSNSQRATITIIMSIPLFISYSVITYYENLFHPRQKLNFNTIITLLLFQVILLLPIIFFLCRYYDVLYGLIIVFSFAGISIPTFFSKKSHAMLKNIVYIHWTAWTPKCDSVDSNHFINGSLQESREAIYTDEASLSTFQKHFLPYTTEDDVIRKLLTAKYNLKEIRKKNLNILDIGGHDGTFTTRLLKKSQIKKVERIDAIEPISTLKDTYVSNLSPFVNRKKIKYHTVKFEDFNPDGYSYDIILASHSLYSPIDNLKFSRKYEEVLNVLGKILNDDGLVIIILGSNDGMAYSLKKDVTRLILNHEIKDTCSEDLNNELRSNSYWNYRKTSVDNYLKIKPLLDNKEDFKKWISYFARVPIINDDYLIEQIINLFEIYSIKYSELPEIVKEYYHDSEKDSLLLCHKTEIFILSKKI